MAKSKKRRRRRRRNVAGRVLLVFLCLVLTVFAAGALYYNSLLNRLSFDQGTTGALSQPIATMAVNPADGAQQAPVPTPNQPILSDEIQHITSGNKAEGEVRRAKNIVNVLLIGQGVHRAMTHRAAGVRAFGLIEHDLISAMGALPRRQFIRPHVDDIAAGAFDFLPREKAGLSFRVFSAHRAGNCKF